VEWPFTRHERGTVPQQAPEDEVDVEVRQVIFGGQLVHVGLVDPPAAADVQRVGV
jgi:hypothetical protein